MSQIAIQLLCLNLWALAVWAAAAGAVRAARPLAAWPGFWLAALILLLAPWALSPLTGAASETLAAPAPRAEISAAAPAPAFDEPLSEAAFSGAAPAPATLGASALPAAEPAAAARPAAVRLTDAIAGAADMLRAAATHPVSQRALAAAAGLYLLIAAMLAARVLIAGQRLRAMARRGRRLDVPGAAAPVILIEDGAPMALGFPRRCILLPQPLTERAGAGEIDMILRHEGAHIRRRDPEATMLLGLVSALFWINPAARDLVRRWRLAAEIQADQAATRQAARAERAAYARLLVSALRARGAAAPAAPAAVLRLDHKGSVKMRLSAILDGAGDRAPRRVKLAAGAALLSVGAAGLAGFGALAQTAPPAPAADAAEPGAPTRLAPAAEERTAYELEREFNGAPAPAYELEREFEIAQAAPEDADRREAELEAAAERREAQLEAAAGRREHALERAEAEREAAEERREAQLEAAAEQREAQLEAAAERREAEIERAEAERDTRRSGVGWGTAEEGAAVIALLDAQRQTSAAQREAALIRARAEREAAWGQWAEQFEARFGEEFARRWDTAGASLEARMAAAGEEMAACSAMLSRASNERIVAAIEGREPDPALDAQTRDASRCLTEHSERFGPLSTELGTMMAELMAQFAAEGAWPAGLPAAPMPAINRTASPEQRARLQANLAEAEQRVRAAQAQLRDAQRQLAALRPDLPVLPDPAARAVAPASPPGVPPARITSGMPDRELEGGPEE